MTTLSINYTEMAQEVVNAMSGDDIQNFFDLRDCWYAGLGNYHYSDHVNFSYDEFFEAVENEINVLLGN